MLRVKNTLEVPIDQSDGMPAECVVNLDNILTITKGILDQPICPLPRGNMLQVNRAITFALGMDDPM